MSSTLRSTGVVALGIVLSMAAFGCVASSTTEQLPSATVVAPQGTATYRVRDMNGRLVTATVPSLGSPAIKVSDPVHGTVPATVVAIDLQRNEAQVRTQKGQRLVLSLPAEYLASMRVGDRFVLQVEQR